MQIEVKPSSSVNRAYDTEIVLVFQDGALKSPYHTLIERLKRETGFQPKLGSMQFVRFGGKAKASNVLLVGVGKRSELSSEKMRVTGGQVFQKLQAERSKGAFIKVDNYQGIDETTRVLHWISAFIEGLGLADYRFDIHKTQASKVQSSGFSKLCLACGSKDLKSQLAPVVKRISNICESIRICRDWSNEPSNIGIPKEYAARAKTIASQHGLKIKILGPKEIESERMGLLAAVGKGSIHPPHVVVVEYLPKGFNSKNGDKTLVWIGKGVTFDSGGYSMKPAAGMEAMKHDMTGAATVMAAMIIAAEQGVKNRIVGIMGFVENMVDGSSYAPGQIFRARNGKTVEVTNTDAEGRLVLADLLDYGSQLNPDAMINVATLTGAMGVSLGKYNCGLFGNDQDLIANIKRAGESCGEKLWELPTQDEYFDDLKSEVADMRNVGPDGLGGSIRGAIFLKQFVGKGVKWAHLDIASVGWNVSHLSYVPKKGASGLFVRTLAALAEEI